MKYTVTLQYDNKANVWIATSEDIQGLVLEADTKDMLMEKVKFAIPDLLSLNGISSNEPLSLCFHMEHNW